MHSAVTVRGDGQGLAVAQRLIGRELSAEAKQQVAAWARDRRDAGSTSGLEHVLVMRALKTHGAAFSAEDRAVLREVYAQGHERFTGKRPSGDVIAPLPTWSRALDDRRARVLQNAVFEAKSLFAGYRPTSADVAVVSAMAALAAVAPALTAAALAGGAAASTVEHQIHAHIMHPESATARFMLQHSKNPLVKPGHQFHLVHKGAHHGHTYLDNDVTKWRPGGREAFYSAVHSDAFRKFVSETEEGIRLTPAGMAGMATVGPLVTGGAVMLGGLALGLSAAVLAPVAVAFGLPMALMPMFPHYMHRFSHMTRTAVADYLDAQRKQGWLGRAKSAVMERVIDTRAFEAVSRFHNQHHADDKHGAKTNMTMLAIADGMLATGRRVSYDLLVSLWTHDAVGFPAGPRGT